jgi:hypothetical protein
MNGGKRLEGRACGLAFSSLPARRITARPTCPTFMVGHRRRLRSPPFEGSRLPAQEGKKLGGDPTHVVPPASLTSSPASDNAEKADHGKDENDDDDDKQPTDEDAPPITGATASQQPVARSFRVGYPNKPKVTALGRGWVRGAPEALFVHRRPAVRPRRRGRRSRRTSAIGRGRWCPSGVAAGLRSEVARWEPASASARNAGLQFG